MWHQGLHDSQSVQALSAHVPSCNSRLRTPLTAVAMSSQSRQMLKTVTVIVSLLHGAKQTEHHKRGNSLHKKQILIPQVRQYQRVALCIWTTPHNVLFAESADVTQQVSSESDDDDISEPSDGPEGHAQHIGKTLVAHACYPTLQTPNSMNRQQLNANSLQQSLTWLHASIVWLLDWLQTLCMLQMLRVLKMTQKTCSCSRPWQCLWRGMLVCCNLKIAVTLVPAFIGTISHNALARVQIASWQMSVCCRQQAKEQQNYQENREAETW